MWRPNRHWDGPPHARNSRPPADLRTEDMPGRNSLPVKARRPLPTLPVLLTIAIVLLPVVRVAYYRDQGSCPFSSSAGLQNLKKKYR